VHEGRSADWHNVNIAESFREPAEIALLTHDPAHTEATYADFRIIRERFGQVPGGMFGGDENSRKGFVDPRQATETCGFVEQMLSDEILFQITGDPFWGDQCETVAFNSYPAAVMPDFKSLRYPHRAQHGLVRCEKSRTGNCQQRPVSADEPIQFALLPTQSFAGVALFQPESLDGTADNGLCATMYSACEVTAKVGDRQQVTISEETQYPFEESLRFTIKAVKPVSFPLAWRIPAWCKSPRLSLNGNVVSVTPKPGQFVRIERTWNDGDKIALDLPMEVSARTWTNNHNSVSVDYGPLTFSLKIGERYVPQDSSKTAQGDSSWQKGADTSKWPSYEIHATSAWNYGLVWDDGDAAKPLKVSRSSWPKKRFSIHTRRCPA